jgi:hypothetical protein
VVGRRSFQGLHANPIAEVETVLHFPGAPAFLGESEGVPRLWPIGPALHSLSKARECLTEIRVGPELTQPQRYQPGTKGCSQVGLVRLVITLGGAKQPAECSGISRASQRIIQVLELDSGDRQAGRS